MVDVSGVAAQGQEHRDVRDERRFWKRSALYLAQQTTERNPDVANNRPGTSTIVDYNKEP